MSMQPSHIEYIETLSLKEQFRLVEIAHETTNADIRALAIQVLQRYLNSVLIQMAQCKPNRSQPNPPA